MRDITVIPAPNGPLLVAVTNNYRRSTILLSNDGRNWELADTPDSAAVLYAVAAGDTGFVAVGTNTDWARPGPESGVVWRSADGLAWSAARVPDLSNAIPLSVEPLSGSGYVAVGWISGESPAETIAWTSPDGVSWHRRAMRDPHASGSLIVVTDSDGSLAVAAGLDPEAYAAFSEDGDEWSSDPLPVANAAPVAVDVSSEAVLIVAHRYIADFASDSYLFVRDRAGGRWRSIDWSTVLGDGGDYTTVVGAAVSQERVLMLFQSGRVVVGALR